MEVKKLGGDVEKMRSSIKKLMLVTTITVFMLFSFVSSVSADCLGWCYMDDECKYKAASVKRPCSECTGTGNYWKYGTGPCLNYCPQCCDSKDNDGDGKTDYPADPECTACLDPSETEPLPPVPELPTIVLFSVGLLALAGYVSLRRRKDN